MLAKLTEQEISKIKQNESENNVYKLQLDKYFSGNMPKHEVINVGSTPNILKILGSKARKIVISQKELYNSFATKDSSSKGHTEGHEIPKQEIYKLSEALRNPIMVLKGNKRNENSVIIITELLNKNGENIFVPISLDRQNGKISNISTLYGKKNLSNYLSANISKILAIDIKKADMLANIGDQYSKFIHDTVVCFDNSIAYTTANVKYPTQQNLQEQTAGSVETDLSEELEDASNGIVTENYAARKAEKRMPMAETIEDITFTEEYDSQSRVFEHNEPVAEKQAVDMQIAKHNGLEVSAAEQAEIDKLKAAYLPFDINSVKTQLDVAKHSIAENGKSWFDFIKQTAYLYKYNLDEAILINAHNPSATLCAKADVWTKRLNAELNADAKPIPLLVNTNGAESLSLVYDISDTNSDFKPWNMQLNDKQLSDIAQTITQRTMDKLSELGKGVDDKVIGFIQSSVMLQVAERTGLETDYTAQDFEYVSSLPQNEKVSFINEIGGIIKAVAGDTLMYAEMLAKEQQQQNEQAQQKESPDSISNISSIIALKESLAINKAALANPANWLDFLSKTRYMQNIAFDNKVLLAGLSTLPTAYATAEMWKRNGIDVKPLERATNILVKGEDGNVGLSAVFAAEQTNGSVEKALKAFNITTEAQESVKQVISDIMLTVTGQDELSKKEKDFISSSVLYQVAARCGFDTGITADSFNLLNQIKAKDKSAFVSTIGNIINDIERQVYQRLEELGYSQTAETSIEEFVQDNFAQNDIDLTSFELAEKEQENLTPDERQRFEENQALINHIKERAFDDKSGMFSNILAIQLYKTGDIDKAFKALNSSALAGNAEGLRNKAILIENHFDELNISNEEKSAENIFDMYKQSAEKGDIQAKTNLGCMYMNGEGTKQNAKLAVQCFAEAAKAGDSLALVNLGDCYSLGNGINPNQKKAFALYEEAANKNNELGCLRTAECYQNGEGVKQSPMKALEYYQKAAAMGSAKAIKEVEKLSAKLNPQKHKEIETPMRDIKEREKAVPKKSKDKGAR